MIELCLQSMTSLHYVRHVASAVVLDQGLWSRPFFFRRVPDLIQEKMLRTFFGSHLVALRRNKDVHLPALPALLGKKVWFVWKWSCQKRQILPEAFYLSWSVAEYCVLVGSWILATDPKRQFNGLLGLGYVFIVKNSSSLADDTLCAWQ